MIKIEAFCDVCGKQIPPNEIHTIDCGSASSKDICTDCFLRFSNHKGETGWSVDEIMEWLHDCTQNVDCNDCERNKCGKYDEVMGIIERCLEEAL